MELGCCPQVEVHVRILEVSRGHIEDLTLDLKDGPFDMIVCLGVAQSAEDFCIEALAKNILAEALPGTECVQSAPMLLLSTAHLTHPSLHKYFPMLSFDAGDYYCNELYYRLLHGEYGRANGLDRPRPVVFIHVPPYTAVPFDVGIQILRDVIERIYSQNCRQQ